MTVGAAPVAAVRQQDRPDGDGGPPGSAGAQASLVHRLRVAAVCACLVALALRVRPAVIVPDTKVDLTANPWAFLARATHLWEPLGFFGQVQNQAYGYLFPMGPFFLATDAVGVPDWVAQRLWWGLLLSTALTGVVWLARHALGLPSWAAIVAGLAYALSPRMMTVLGGVSVEILPMALAPWVVVPLVHGCRAGASPRRAAALSGLAVLLMGGVNAAATLAALPPAVLWLLTRRRGPRRPILIRWWLGCVALATAWWLVALAALGAVSPPFLDFIEDAAVTTRVTSAFEVLRGTSHWVAWLADAGGPSWPGGYALVSSPILVLHTVLLAAAGLAGIALPAAREALWLRLCFATGAAAVTFGHLGHAWSTSPWAGWANALLDGPLAPFRNVHKLDPTLRLALALGVGVLLTRLASAGSARVRVATVVLTGLALVGAGTPLLRGDLAPPGGYTELPAYWSQAARWLDERSDAGAALLVPASGFADYAWGRPTDEPLQPFSGRPWAVRNAVPLTPPGTIRYLDAVEARLATGSTSPGLSEALARAGVRFVVVRNDLDYGQARSARPIAVHQALTRSTGFRLAATFGPEVGGANRSGDFVDQDLDVPYPAVEIFEVAQPVRTVSLAYAADALRVAGGPETVLGLADQGWLQGRPLVLGDAGADVGSLRQVSTVISDDVRRREVSFGRTTANRSAVLAADDDGRLGRRARDYLEPGWPQTTALLAGADAVTASSSRSDAAAGGGARPADHPVAAVDGDERTAWFADPARPATEQWWQVDLGRAVELSGGTVEVADDPAGPTVREIAVSVDGATPRHAAVVDGRARLPDVSGGVIRLSVAALDEGVRSGAIGFREVVIPGVQVTQRLDVPSTRVAGAPWLYLASPPAAPECFDFSGRALCGEGVGQPPEEPAGVLRQVDLASGGLVYGSMVVTARPGAAQARALLAHSDVQVTASSTAVSALRGAGFAALDGDLGTGWVAASGDRSPWLEIRWPQRRTVDGIRVELDPALAASAPARVTVVGGGERRTVDVRDGVAHFDPVRATSVRVVVDDVAIAQSYDQYRRRSDLLPAGVSELTLLGPGRSPARVRLPEQVSTGCEEGLALRVSGAGVLRFAVTATTDEVLREGPLIARPCSDRPLELTAGPTTIDARATGAWDVDSVALSPTTEVAAVRSPGDVVVTRVDAASRKVDVPARDADVILRLTENANRGWRATLDGTVLEPVVLDGFQQGYLVPVGAAGTVQLTFEPDRFYRWGLVAGLLGAVALVGIAVAGRPSREPAAGAGAPAPVLLGSLALVAALAIGGWLAAVLTGAGLLVARRGPTVLAAVAGGALVVAGLPVVVQPWPRASYPGFGPLTATLVCVAVAAALATLPVAPSGVGGGGGSGTRSRRRRQGSSTKR